MPNLEWEAPHTLVTPQGSLDLNVADPLTGRKYLILPDYKIVPTLRVTQDNLSQADGEEPHPRWKTGLIVSMSVRYVIADNPGQPDDPGYTAACGQDLREMHELLILHLNSIRQLSPNNALAGSSGSFQRLYWTPTGYGDQRLLDAVLLASWPEPIRENDNVDVGVSFSLESPFPYAIDSTEVDVPVSGSTIITNNGNSDFLPVVEVSASSSFSITNGSVVDDLGNPLTLVFDAALPDGVAITGSDYAEIDFFRGTIFLNGDSTDLIASIDPTYSDFFPLVPGPNSIVVSGTVATFKTNNAWA